MDSTFVNYEYNLAYDSNDSSRNDDGEAHFLLTTSVMVTIKPVLMTMSAIIIAVTLVAKPAVWCNVVPIMVIKSFIIGLVRMSMIPVVL